MFKRCSCLKESYVRFALKLKLYTVHVHVHCICTISNVSQAEIIFNIVHYTCTLYMYY